MDSDIEDEDESDTLEEDKQMAAEELLSAIESKDALAVADAIEALVMLAKG